MKKVKVVFYSVYILTIILVVIMAFNMPESLNLFQKLGWFKYFSDLPLLARNLLLFLSSLMVIELLIQSAQIVIFKKRSRTRVKN